MTFNIWNYHRPWKERRAIIADLIRHHQPDVAVLQETRHDFRYEGGLGQDEQLAAITGYHPTWAKGQVYVPILRVDEGLAILTRETPKAVMMRELARLPHERDDSNQRVCLGVTVESRGREVHIFNTHFSLSERARVSNAREVARFIREQSGDEPALVMGDLNAEPHTLPIRFLLGEEEIDGEVGDFVDCWLAANPQDPGYTYASWEGIRRIDYVLGRNLPVGPLTAELIGMDAANEVYASDHLGIVTTFPF